MPDCFDEYVISAYPLSPATNFSKTSKPFPPSSYPPDTDEKKAALQKFFKETGNFQTMLPRINKVIETLAAEGKSSIGA